MKTKKEELFSMFDHVAKSIDTGIDIGDDYRDKIIDFIMANEAELMSQVPDFIKKAKLPQYKPKSKGFGEK